MSPRLKSLLLYLPYLAVAAFVTVALYWSLFSQFGIYDDESYLLISLREFLQGHTLYQDVYTQYGPFYYEFFGAFFKLTGIEISNDAGRLIVLVLLVFMSTGFGLLARFVTKNNLIGLITQVTAAYLCFNLTFEPMHPLGLTSLLVFASLVAIAVARRPGWLKGAAIAVGISVGALAMVKINMGALGAVALISAAALGLGGGPDRKWLRAGAVALLVVAPIVLLSTNLRHDWVQRLLILELAGSAAIVIRAWGLTDADDDGGSVRWMAWFGAALVATVAAICLGMLVLGVSPHWLIDGIVLDPARHPHLDVAALMSPQQVVDWSIITVAVALIVTVMGRGKPRPQLLLARSVARFAATAIVIFAITGQIPDWLSPAAGILPFAVLLTWIAAVAPRGVPESRNVAFSRLALALFAVVEMLQFYPVAGNQLQAAALPFALIGAIVAGDGVTLARQWMETRNIELNTRRIALGALGCVMLAVMLVPVFGDRARTAGRLYADNKHLDVHGGERLKLVPEVADDVNRLTAAIKSHNCDPLVTLPGLNSFYFWSQKNPPTTQNANNWIFLLNDDRQQQVVDAIKDKPKLCLLTNSFVLSMHLQRNEALSNPPPPLYGYLTNIGLRQISQSTDGQYRLYVRGTDGNLSASQ